MNDHLGNKYKTKKDMCDAYGISVNTFDTRISRGASLEKALTTPVKKQDRSHVFDHLGNKYTTLKDMLKKYNITRAAFENRVKNGWPLEKALTTPVKKQDRTHVFDHLGNEFKSYAQMARFYGLGRTTLRRRIVDGWPLEKALTGDIIPNQVNKPIDHLGNKYNNIKELCDKYNITSSAYEYRIHSGWSLEKTLTTPLKSGPDIIKDHLGNKYKTKKEMCDKYNITPDIFNARLDKGYTLEQALTEPVNNNKKQSIDHLGNIYDSETEMANYYNLQVDTYSYRIKNGWSLEKALTTPVKSDIIKDHLGNKYKTIKEMCDKYNINPGVFRSRLKRGYTLEQALTMKSTNKKIVITDPIYGDKVNFITLSERYNIPKNKIESRHSIKWRICEILEISPRISEHFKGVRDMSIKKYDLTINARINENVFECDINGQFKIMSKEMIDQYCIEKYKEEHNIKDQG